MTRPNTCLALCLAFCLPLVLAGCEKPDSNKQTMNARMNALADRYVEAALERTPEMAYFTGLPAPTHARLSDNSLQALAQWRAFEDAMAVELEAIDPDKLDKREWMAWGGMKELLEASRGLSVCRSELWQTVNHMFGWHLGMSFIASRQPVATAAEREDALQRWRGLPVYVDTEITNLTEGLEKGYSAARPVALAMLKQIDGMANSPAEDWPLYSMAERAGDEAFTKELVTLIDNDLRAAVERYREFLQHTYIPAAREDLSVTALPEGETCYRAMLRDYTTLDRNADAVFVLGKSTVEGNLEKVRAIASKEFGLSELDAIVAHVNEAPDNRFESEEHIVEHSRAIVRAAREKVAPLFLSLPEAPVVVEPFPEYQRGSGRSSHYQPPGNDGEPGEYRISLDFWETETIGGAEITAVHEAWPGHHLQIGRTVLLSEHLTRFQRHRCEIAGYVEGWGLYAEQLMDELDFFDEPADQLGFLRGQFLRTARVL
ncbi:MAG: DUF885 domain-containing protein, partial [Proteobacteria bacterium]|nr:DUF885 domain-containing protein [Pseudomonadota bacterium]